MIIHLSDKKKYRKKDSYSKKMSYSITLFNGSWKDFQNLKKDKRITDKRIVWYSK